jgi:amino acid transporter
VNSFYWLLTVLTGQLAMIFYILLFAAAIRLHYKKPHVARSFRIPGGKLGMWLVSGSGILICLFTLLVGFMPPSQVAVGNVMVYETILIVGILLFCAPPLLLRKRLT